MKTAFMKSNLFPSYTAILFCVLTVLSMGSAAYSQDGQTPGQLTEVDSKYVCMVTDKLFDKEQIPVEVEGKTYYGCCEMCKGKLQSDVSVREAADPVSGNTVDKSTAVIGATSSGDILYFENEETLQAYNTSSGN